MTFAHPKQLELAQRVDMALGGQVARQVDPGLAVVRGLEQVRPKIIGVVIVHRDIGRGRVEVRGLDS